MASKDNRHKLPSYPRIYLTIARQELNISAEELSRRLDLSKSYYYALENGSRGHNMTVQMLDKIVKCLNLDANDTVESEMKYQEERKAFLKYKRIRR